MLQLHNFTCRFMQYCAVMLQNITIMMCKFTQYYNEILHLHNIMQYYAVILRNITLP